MDLDLGAEAINTDDVVVPTDEKIVGFAIQLTSDQKWSQFHIPTTQRSVTVNPGEFGQEDFATMCARVKAMIQTDEGKLVIQAAKAALRKRPLALKTTVEVTNVEA